MTVEYREEKMMTELFRVLAGQEPYFTGKIESYLRAKGIPHQNIPFTPELLQKVGSITGFVQIP